MGESSQMKKRQILFSEARYVLAAFNRCLVQQWTQRHPINVIYLGAAGDKYAGKWFNPQSKFRWRPYAETKTDVL
jgi:hypothetical protein